MEKTVIRPVENDEEFQEVLNVRRKVFIEGQDVSEELEIDGLDNEAEHIVVKYDDKIVGCARIRYFENKAKLERIAILEGYRGKGLGKQLTKYLVEHALEKADEVIMNAQYYLLDFYKSLGFEPFGQKFMEAGIEHIEMRIAKKEG